MSRQLGLSPRDLVLWLCVKFYTPDPAKLEDELTRYLFSLQIRRDLAQGQLKCNSKTAAVLVSYIVQCKNNACGVGGLTAEEVEMFGSGAHETHRMSMDFSSYIQNYFGIAISQSM